MACWHPLGLIDRSTKLSVCLFVCLSPSVSVCLSLSVCRSIHLSVGLSVCLSVCPSVGLSVCLSRSVYWSIRLSVGRSIRLSLSVCLSIRLSVCLSSKVLVFTLSFHFNKCFLTNYSHHKISVGESEKWFDVGQPTTQLGAFNVEDQPLSNSKLLTDWSVSKRVEVCLPVEQVEATEKEIPRYNLFKLQRGMTNT